MASIISLQAMGGPVSARTSAPASIALGFLGLASTSADFFRAFLGLPFLGLFDAAITCLPFWALRISGSADVTLPSEQDQLPPVRAEIQAIPAGIGRISASSLEFQESRKSPQAGLEVGAVSSLSEQCELAVFESYPKGGTYARERRQG